MSELAARLGYADDTRILIVACSNLGVSHAANSGVYAALRHGIATSASVMLPCPWSREAADHGHSGDDVGIQLTLNSEFEVYRWGPITHAPTLLDGDGGFPRTVADLWDHAAIDEVHRECRAQVERAGQWGFDLTHIGSHLSALQLRPEFFSVMVELAEEFALPIRLPAAPTEQWAQFPIRQLAADAGILHADNVIALPEIGTRSRLLGALEDLPAGVTEVCLHPAADTPELRAYAPDWEARADDLALATEDTELADRLQNLTLLGYRNLRDLQRATT